MAQDGLATSTINLRILAAAVPFASKDEARYYLNGVCLEIEPRAVTYVATDGHRMIAYRDELQDDGPDNLLLGTFIIPTPHCKPHKLEKNDAGLATIFGSGRLTIAYGFCDVTFLPIDGSFVNWRKTIPAFSSGVLAQFNLEYLAAFKKFGAALELPSPFVAHNGADAPATVWFPGRQDIIGIIMPIKTTDELGRVAPEWSRVGGSYDQADIEDAA